jgi:hypothetical protein
MTARFTDHILTPGTHAALPATATTPVGTLYPCTDHGKVYRNNGAAWQDWAQLGDPGTAAALADHLADTADAHDASAISFAPAGTIAATNVQAAIEEVLAEGGGVDYRGTWTAVDTYEVDDLVILNGDAYIATAAHAANDSPAPVLSQNGIMGESYGIGTSDYGYRRVATGFRVTTTVAIKKVSVRGWGSPGVVAGDTVGIASDFGTGQTPTYLAVGTVATTAAAGVLAEVTFDTAVTLSPGVTYRAVWIGNTSNSHVQLHYADTARSGIIASPVLGSIHGNGPSAWDSTTGQFLSMRFWSESSPTGWDKVAGHSHPYAAASHTHAATAITYAGSTNLSATNVEAALDELDTEKAATGHTHGGVEGRPLVDPTGLSWSWVNQGGALVSSRAGAIFLESPAEAADVWHFRAKTVPAKPYSVIIHMQPAHFDVAYSGVGVGWMDSATGKFALCGHRGSGNMLEASYSTAQWRVTNVYASAALTDHWPWIKLTDDATNRRIYVSRNGYDWLLFHSVATNDQLTPDQMIFGVQSRSGMPVGVTIDSWEEGV